MLNTFSVQYIAEYGKDTRSLIRERARRSNEGRKFDMRGTHERDDSLADPVREGKGSLIHRFLHKAFVLEL